MTSRMSSGSSRADSDVEPTRPQNITVSCRRSSPLVRGAGVQATGAGAVTLPIGLPQPPQNPGDRLVLETAGRAGQTQRRSRWKRKIKVKAPPRRSGIPVGCAPGTFARTQWFAALWRRCGRGGQHPRRCGRPPPPLRLESCRAVIVIVQSRLCGVGHPGLVLLGTASPEHAQPLHGRDRGSLRRRIRVAVIVKGRLAQLRVLGSSRRMADDGRRLEQRVGGDPDQQKNRDDNRRHHLFHGVSCQSQTAAFFRPRSAPAAEPSGVTRSRQAPLPRVSERQEPSRGEGAACPSPLLAPDSAAPPAHAPAGAPPIYG